MRYFLNLLFALSTVIAFVSCSKDDDSNDNHFAISSAKGHSFQFYTNTRRLFSVDVSSKGVVTTKHYTGWKGSDDQTFDYQKISNSKATSQINVGYISMGIGGDINLRITGDMLLTFDMPKGGYYRLYDWDTEQLSTGRFTIDKEESETVPTGPTHPNAGTDMIINSYPLGHNGWAGSNIYWKDGVGLTFDPPAGYAGYDENNQKKQGLFFQWGSLVGISPEAETEEDIQAMIYPRYKVYMQWNVATGGMSLIKYWDYLEYMKGVINGGTGYDYLSQTTNFEAEEQKGLGALGDICRYMTYKAGGQIYGKKWRMPVFSEFEIDKTTYTTNIFSNVTTVDSKGEKLVNSYATNANTGIIFPASGCRNGDFFAGEYTAAGRYGCYWSSSPNRSTAYAMRFDENGIDQMFSTYHFRDQAYPVRCVAE